MQPIYIEVSDEITTVIERLRGADDLSVALVVPRGAILLQSLVNLKLVKKAAADAGKEVSLITTDKIGKNLASQVGLPVFARLDEQNNGESAPPTADEKEPAMVAGVKVHRYYEDQNETDEEEGTAEPQPEPIIPKEILRPEPEVAVLPAAEMPITLRPVQNDLPPKEEPVDEPAVEEEPSSTSLVAVPEDSPTPRKRKRALIFALYLLLLLLLATSGVGAFYLPSSTVKITIPSEAWSKELVTTAGVAVTAPSSDGTIIPAQVITAESSDSITYTSTGKKEVGDKAQGTAQIFNGYSSTPQLLPSGSALSVNGLTFITQSDVTVPGAQVQNGKPVPGSVNVNIVADQPGADGNMSNVAGTVSSPNLNLYCQIVSTTGGSTKEVSVVTDTDIANAKDQLNKKLMDASKAKLVDQLKNLTVFSDEHSDLFSLTDYKTSQLSGTLADTFVASGKGIIKRLVVDQNVLKTVAAFRSKDQGPDVNSIVDDTTLTKIQVSFVDQKATLTTLTKGRKAAIVPLDSIRTQLVGKSQSDGIALIQLIVKDAQVELSQKPSWWPNRNFPYSNRYLHVQVTYE